MVAAVEPLTYKDLALTPEGDGNRYELLGGELFVTPSPSIRHARVSNRIARLEGNFVTRRALGEVIHGPADVRLSPFDVVVPDIIYISAERLNLFGIQFVEAGPDLIVEVLSPSTKLRDQTSKLQLYARTGVAEYWIVDIERSSVTVNTLNANATYDTVEVKAGRVKSRVLPDLKLSVSEIFKGLD
jgi:Uma2 family endonuclease